MLVPGRGLRTQVFPIALRFNDAEKFCVDIGGHRPGPPARGGGGAPFAFSAANPLRSMRRVCAGARGT